jgi:hypothetical protein
MSGRPCEVSFTRVRRIGQPVEKVGAEPNVTTNRSPEAPKSPTFGVFGARSGVGVGIEGVFQHAEVFCELRLMGLLGTSALRGSTKFAKKVVINTAIE